MFFLIEWQITEITTALCGVFPQAKYDDKNNIIFFSLLNSSFQNL